MLDSHLNVLPMQIHRRYVKWLAEPLRENENDW